MTSIIYSTKHYQELKDQVAQSFSDFIQDVREDLDEGHETDFLSPNFLRELRAFIQTKELQKYSPLAMHWAHNLDSLIQIVQLHEEMQENQNNQELCDELEEEIFHFWDQHEHAPIFIEITQKGKGPQAASLELIPLLENQLLSFYQLHLTKDPFVSDRPLLYHAIPEKGDGDLGLSIGEEAISCPLEIERLEGLIPISRVDHQQAFIEVQESEDKVYNAPFGPQATLIKTDQLQLLYLPICQKGVDQKTRQIQRIEKALTQIKKYSPQSYELIQNFCEAIVPIDEAGVVSYSMQSLPGHSCLNLFERNDLDLMDDLVHEHGHHYLNAYLNHTELINEGPDQVYYSPWRRALRPIRGIYHAYCTFFWALKLFSDVAFQDSDPRVLTRALEEAEMLSFCHPLLEWAYERGDIEEEGYQVFKSFQSEVELIREKLPKQNDGPEIRELKKHLNEMKKKYHSKL